MAELLQFPSPVESSPRPDSRRGDPPDAAARDRALDPRQSFIVEAPAGSGKTGLLVKRFLRLLLDPELDTPEEVLAITFTRKATAELRERIHLQLERAATGGPPPAHAPAFEQNMRALAVDVLERDRKCGWNILDRPQRLNIRSIDSVCSAIAGAMPVLSGMGGQRTVLEKPQPLYRLAAHRTLMQLGGSDAVLDQALRTILLHRDANLADAESLLASMLEAREQWGELVPFTAEDLSDEVLDREVRPRLEATLDAIICSALTRAASLIPAGTLAELAAIAHAWSDLPGYKGASRLLPCRDLPSAPEAVAECLEHWKILVSLLLTASNTWRTGFNSNQIGLVIPNGEKARLRELIEGIESEPLQKALAALPQLPPARYPEEQWRVTKALFRVLRHAMAELTLLFAERSACDFAELSLDARAALRQEPALADLALAGGGRLRHLLVDEMQDTSAAQYDLLEQITRSWDGRTQTLFLVGDPKQSIYAFRKAMVTRFLRTMQERRLGELQLEPLRLSANFRSQQVLVEQFNHTFQQVFPSAEEALQQPERGDVPFVGADAVLEASELTPLHWHITCLPDGSDRASADKEQARHIRQVIQLWRNRTLPPERNGKPWRIAVLARARNSLAPIAGELREAGIPFRGVEIESLGERQEVLDALALTRALLHLGDRTAWLAVLRAPWCGLTLADLLRLTGEGADADPHTTVIELVSTRAHLLSEPGRRLLERAWPVLQQAIATLGQTTLAAHVERTWRSLGGDAPLGVTARRNAEIFFRLLAEVETENDGRVEPGTLSLRLQDLFAESSGTELDVQLMTIHKAKGLEWDVVLVPNLERKPANDRSRLLNWIELDGESDGHAGGQILLAPIEQRGDETGLLNTWLQTMRSVRDRSERKRLLYVACTRAIHELHLFATPEKKKDGTPKEAVGSLLEVAWPAAQPHLSTDSGELFANGVTEAAEGSSTASLNDEHLSTLALAASEEESEDENSPAHPPENASTGDDLPFGPPQIHRLPEDFDPLARFRGDGADRLPLHPRAAASATEFERPEGSFPARAFGNVVHRLLERLAGSLAQGLSATDLLDDLPHWVARVEASLRGEGVSPATVAREAGRVLEALRSTLRSPLGLWILSPHTDAASEDGIATADSVLRADRTFRAGTKPGISGDSDLWIVDFKTAEQGSRTIEAFEAMEREKYTGQMEAYARVRRQLAGAKTPIHLALFYPLSGHLICWDAANW